MPMSPRTNVFCDSLLTNRVYFCCKTNLQLKVSERQGKHSFAQYCFYFQCIFSYINERDRSPPDCKYSHMLQNGALPHSFGVLYHLLHIEFHDFNSRIMFRVTTFWFLKFKTNFTDGMGPLNRSTAFVT